MPAIRTKPMRTRHFLILCVRMVDRPGALQSRFHLPILKISTVLIGGLHEQCPLGI